MNSIALGNGKLCQLEEPLHGVVIATLSNDKGLTFRMPTALIEKLMPIAPLLLIEASDLEMLLQINPDSRKVTFDLL
jgi:hypothetical protein